MKVILTSEQSIEGELVPRGGELDLPKAKAENLVGQELAIKKVVGKHVRVPYPQAKKIAGERA